MKFSPPSAARRLLFFFLRDDLAEEVAGDLEENYVRQIKARSRFHANLNYWYQVIQYFRPFAFRKLKPYSNNRYAMIQNYVKISWRNLLKQSMYSAIKIGGLALGIASCLLIALFIRDEISYDKHVPDNERIYRVVGVLKKDGGVSKGVHFPAPFGPSMKEDYPEIEIAARYNPVELFGAGNKEIRRADREDNTYEEGFVFADQEILDILQVPMVYGQREKALASPMSIVITRSKADKFFPNEDPIGKMFIIDDDKDKLYTVGGVIEDFPSTSHFRYDFLITLEGLEFYKGEQTSWGENNYPTYIRLRPGTDPKVFETKLSKGVIEKYFLPRMIEDGVVNAKEMVANAHLELQPLTDIHLYSDDIDAGIVSGDIRFVWLFGSIAGFILIIACINFINLSTARSANRAKEVGLRKVVGSFRSSLINQFLTESIIFSMISFVIGMALACLMLPYFNVLAAKSLTFPWQSWWLLPAGIAVILVIGLIAGLYPSFYLSSFKPIEVLKGNLSRGSKSQGMRSALVIFQFTTSIVLIVGTFIIDRQMNFILNKKVGFEKDQVIMLQGTNTLGSQMQPFIEELRDLSVVKSVSVGDYLPVRGMKRNGNPFYKEGNAKTDKAVDGQRWLVDFGYIETMGMKIVEGRNFSRESETDRKQAAIINQQMVKELGLSDPIGAPITNAWLHYVVIGVVEDFNYESLKQQVRPVCLVMGDSPNVVSVRVNSSEMSDAIESISAIWKKRVPHQPIRYGFLDDHFAKMYDDVQRMGRIFTCFAVLAIIVACLGLFALSSFMIEQRGKEMSIRIVLGAPMAVIFRLLTQSFLILVGISIVIAVPLSWFMMKEWLKDFAYKIDLSWEVFALAGLMAISIALLTVSYQAIRAALINPVRNLRSE